MAWTYSGDPSTSVRDKVRFIVGDTYDTDQLLLDAEVDWVLTEYPNVMQAAAVCAERIAAKFARLADKSVGDLSISYQQRRQGYLDLVKTLKNEAALGLAPPYAGGISASDKETDENDSDRVAPAFTVDMHSQYAKSTNPDWKSKD